MQNGGAQSAYEREEYRRGSSKQVTPAGHSVTYLTLLNLCFSDGVSEDVEWHSYSSVWTWVSDGHSPTSNSWKGFGTQRATHIISIVKQAMFCITFCIALQDVAV